MNLDEVTLETFEPHVGSVFTLKFESADPVHLKLVRAAPIMERISSEKLKRKPFSLFFEGNDTVVLPQRMYAFTHESLTEPLPIFIVPLGRENGVMTYEAVFT